MNVTLKPEVERLIEEDVKSGRSSGPGDFLNRAVYHYVLARDLGEAYSPEEIDSMIAEGLAEIDRGYVVEGEDALESYGRDIV